MALVTIGLCMSMRLRQGGSMIEGAYPPAFPLKHQLKDLRLALELGAEVGQPLPVAATARRLYEQARPAPSAAAARHLLSRAGVLAEEPVLDKEL